MKIPRLQIFIGVFLYCAGLLGQPQIKFEKSLHDFGTIANLDYPPASFKFTNMGDGNLAILLIRKNNAVKVSYETRFYAPGESGLIYVLPNLNRMGAFSETIFINTNASVVPQSISIKGLVISTQACFPNANDLTVRKINVVNKVDKSPVPEASLEVLFNVQPKITVQTDNQGQWQGQLPIGQYSFKIQANGFKTLLENRFIGRSVPVLFFELTPMLKPIMPKLILINEPVENTAGTEMGKDVEEKTILSKNKYAANNIVLLVDVSFSMKSGNKLELLKASMINLVGVLRNIDNVSLISYAQAPVILIESIPGDKKNDLYEKINELNAYGVTNGVMGLESAYQLSIKKFIRTGNNQIILATDGKFTGGATQPEKASILIDTYAKQGIILSIVGFGVDEEAKNFMELMAQNGKGTYRHVTNEVDISELLVDEIKSKSFISKPGEVH